MIETLQEKEKENIQIVQELEKENQVLFDQHEKARENNVRQIKAFKSFKDRISNSVKGILLPDETSQDNLVENIPKQTATEKVAEKIKKKRLSSKSKNSKLDKTKKTLKELKQPTKRSGKPKGSGGGGRKRPLTESTYDETRVLSPPRCENADCRKKFPKDLGIHGKYTRHLINVERPKRSLVCVVILYIVNRKKCPYCKKVTSARSLLPCHKNYLFGYGYMSQALMKRISSKGILVDVMEDLKASHDEQTTPTISSLNRWILKMGDQMGPVLDYLVTLLKKSPYIKIDETNLPMDGHTCWMWVFCTEFVRIFIPSYTRSHVVPKAILEDYPGWIMTDFFKAYNKLPQTKTKCHVHLVRNIFDIVADNVRRVVQLSKELEDDESLSTQTQPKPGRPKKIPIQPLTERQRIQKETKIVNLTKEADIAQELFDFLIEQDKKDFHVDKCRKIFKDLMTEFSTVFPSSKTPLQQIFNRIEKYWDDLFRYKDLPLKDRKTLHNNNLAEGTVKVYAKLRRTHGVFRSWLIAEAVSTCLSICETSKLTNYKKSKFEFWKSLCNGNLANFLNHVAIQVGDLQTFEENLISVSVS